MFVEEPLPVDGYITLSNKPGFGLELNKEKLHLVRPYPERSDIKRGKKQTKETMGTMGTMGTTKTTKTVAPLIPRVKAAEAEDVDGAYRDRIQTLEQRMRKSFLESLNGGNKSL